jgi:hypothetical protein
MDSFEQYFMQGLTDGLEKQASANEEPTETPVSEIIKKAMAGMDGKKKKAMAQGTLLQALLAKKK